MRSEAKRLRSRTALFVGLIVVMGGVVSTSGCSRKSRDELAAGMRLGKASKACEKEGGDCASCCQGYDATFSGTSTSGKCHCSSTDATYSGSKTASSGTAAAAAAGSQPSGGTSTTKGRTIVHTNGALSMDLPSGYRPVKGLSEEPTNWVQARSDEGFGDRYVSVNSIAKDGQEEPFDKFVAARIKVLRTNVEDPSTTPAIVAKLPQGPAMTYEVKVDKHNARMLITFLDTPKHLHEIKAWSVAGTFTTARPELERMPGLVREK